MAHRRSKFDIVILFRYFRYLDNRVFVSLANGELIVYSRDHRMFSQQIQFICIRCRNCLPFHSILLSLYYSQTPGTPHHHKRYRLVLLQIQFQNCWMFMENFGVRSKAPLKSSIRQHCKWKSRCKLRPTSNQSPIWLCTIIKYGFRCRILR